MFHFETFQGKQGGTLGIITLPAPTARPPRRWKLRNPRNDDGPPLTAAERRIGADADLYTLIAAVIETALDDLSAGWGDSYQDYGTANEQYWRAQAYLWFFHGDPTGFERFARRLGIQVDGRLPPHPLLDDPTLLAARRLDLSALGLPLDLFDRRLEELAR